MKTRVFLTVAFVFSLAVMSCGNKKAADANAETTVQVCDSACTKNAGECCANDSACKGNCNGACAGDCDKVGCQKMACDKACEK